MVEVTFHTARPPHIRSAGEIHVVLYDGDAHHGAPRVGGPVKEAVRRLGHRPSVRAFDLLTVALAVTAADTFVRRRDASDVGWGRDLRISTPLAHPAPWAPLVPLLREALGFLTGDRWDFDFRGGGTPPPPPMAGGEVLACRGADLVCLFSGGLDSTIGVLDLLNRGHRPLLVSHSYPGDAGKQIGIRKEAFPDLPRFAAAARPCWPASGGFDTTMRGRSFGFLAMAGVAASVLSDLRGGNRVRLMVPENGFIAINAPLTPRRIGSLSTRTTHPHFLGLMQRLFDGLGLPADVENPYEFRTKGEMLSRCADKARLATVAATTVSCGKWKRRHVQCGRCVPCIVRRASFEAAAVPDPTDRYEHPVLADVLSGPSPGSRGDLLAMARAARWPGTRELARRVGASGPLPPATGVRSKYEAVVDRGLREVGAYLRSCGISV